MHLTVLPETEPAQDDGESARADAAPGREMRRPQAARVRFDQLGLGHRIGSYAVHTERALKTAWYHWYVDPTQHADGQPRPPWPLESSTLREFIYACSPPGLDPTARADGAASAIPRRSRAARTVLRYLSCLRMLHKASGEAGDPFAHPDLDAARRIISCGRLATTPKDPLRLEHLEQLLARPTARPLALRDRAMFAIGWNALLRRSEIVALRREDLEVAEDGWATVLVRASKTDPGGGARCSRSSRGWSTRCRRGLRPPASRKVRVPAPRA